ncbi:iron-containing alcohol dehydrogenase [Desulfovibrio aminophilus]|uniref:iron-containing alcohol dehydrogenase n=1 Tax=Desulfovibrio aminophilus TaxID=81425 RepID=UPI00339B49BD
MPLFQFFLPTRLLFGPGSLESLADTPHLPKGRKALIVTSSGGSMIRHGFLGRVQGLLASRGVASMVYDRVRPNPESDQVDEAAALAREAGTDFILGLGGGSPLDVAKAAAVMARNPGSVWDYVQGGSGGGRQPENAPLPLVCVPSTAGTGSEMNYRSVITRTGSPEKLAWGVEAGAPVLSVVDPDLTLTMPPRLTALTGMDALFHAVEGFLSLRRQPLTDLVALEAIHLVANHLPRAAAEGSDREARTVLSWASCSGGICLALSSTTILHALEHALSALKPDLPHGEGLVMLAQACFRHIASKAPERFDELSLALGCDEDQAGPEGFLAALARLMKESRLAVPRLADCGLTREDIPALAKNALDTNSRLLEATPGDLGLEDMERILEDALSA